MGYNTESLFRGMDILLFFLNVTKKSYHPFALG